MANDDVRSEGMSYGMMIAVQLDRKDVFDALWNWSKTYMWHGDANHPFYEYFAWDLDTEGNALDDAPAPDGEEYFAMALYFAAGRWASAGGIYNYPLDGTPLADNYYSPSVVAMNATSALSATDESLTADFVEALWSLPVPTGLYRYYDGVLYMLAMLHVSGNFRIYSPK